MLVSVGKAREDEESKRGTLTRPLSRAGTAGGRSGAGGRVAGPVSSVKYGASTGFATGPGPGVSSAVCHPGTGVTGVFFFAKSTHTFGRGGPGIFFDFVN